MKDRANSYAVGSSTLAFFSDKSMSSLSRRLGHDKVRQLVRAIEAQTAWRLNLLTDVDPIGHAVDALLPNGGPSCLFSTEEKTSLYMKLQPSNPDI